MMSENSRDVNISDLKEVLLECASDLKSEIDSIGETSMKFDYNKFYSGVRELVKDLPNSKFFYEPNGLVYNSNVMNHLLNEWEVRFKEMNLDINLDSLRVYFGRDLDLEKTLLDSQRVIINDYKSDYTKLASLFNYKWTSDQILDAYGLFSEVKAILNDQGLKKSYDIIYCDPSGKSFIFKHKGKTVNYLVLRELIDVNENKRLRYKFEFNLASFPLNLLNLTLMMCKDEPQLIEITYDQLQQKKLLRQVGDIYEAFGFDRSILSNGKNLLIKVNKF